MTETQTASPEFQVGRTYATRSACNHDCIYEFTVIKRTKKFLTLETRHGEISRRGVYTYEGQEHCKPHGTHSMCPVISAKDDDIIEGGIRHEVEAKARRLAEAKARPQVADPQAPLVEKAIEEAPNPDFRYQDAGAVPMNDEAREAFRLLEEKHGRRAMVENGVAWCMTEGEALLRRSQFKVA
jgi:hypothetical protein